LGVNVKVNINVNLNEAQQYEPYWCYTAPRMKDYSHARHAGNHGDVLKHVALVAVLRDLIRDPAPLLYVDSHAGDGRFTLGSVGEWGDGISRLWDLDVRGEERPVEIYRAAVGRFSPRGAARPAVYPGSPLIAQALTRPQDELRLFEIDGQAAHVLRKSLGGDGRAQVFEEDGLAGVARALAAAGGRRALLLIDPPYSDKAEWTAVARAVPELYRAFPEATVLLWYPVRAMTRPVALLIALAEAGVHGTALELIATPLRLKREKLNGSGVVLLRPPDPALRALCADLPDLGQRLATRGEWTSRLLGF
jgi:23S rRNA (adenine2030-N6)-methyltransferase